MKEAWQEQRQVILMAASCKEPAQAALMPKLAGATKSMKAVGALTKRNEWEKFCKTAAEGVQALNWLVVKPAPRDFIQSYLDGAEYWANGIRKEFRTVDADKVAFCDLFKAILTGLLAYVKDHHLTGLTWNPKGVDVADWTGTTAGVTAVPATAVAVDAKVAPPAPPAAAATAAPAGKPSGASLFAELNKGGAITSGLKAVTKDQQTWRAEYKGGNAPAPAPSAPKAPAVSKRPVETVKGPAKIEYVPPQNKWLVQYQAAAECASGPVTVTINEKKEMVYILGCLGAHIKVVGKCNGIVVDSCKRCTVTFDTVLASVELVNCQRMTVSCLESASSFAIDKTDGCIVALPKTSLHSEIFASKSSEMNVQWFHGEGEDEELIERPIPEQYVHRINAANKTVSADVSDLYSH